MAATILASGTLTAAANSEHVVATVTSGYTMVWQISMTNLSSGDQTELRMYTKVISSDAFGVAFYEKLNDAQSSNDLVKTSLPLTVVNAAQFTLQQNSGTGRSYTWSILGI